jgi:hypothetical protein
MTEKSEARRNAASDAAEEASEVQVSKAAERASYVELPKTKSRAYVAHGGAYYVGDSAKVLTSRAFANLKGRVQLLVTSPPYPLNEKKSYGNLTGEEYLRWMESLATVFSDLLTDDGSIVIEVGNSWEPNRSVQSLLALEALLAFTKAKGANLRLVQQFVCYNPSRLPSPASYVTVKPMRTVDSFTHVWWLAKTDTPKADNRKVLRPYSKAMKDLLKRGAYNSGRRPSEHTVSEKGFLNDRGGSIAHNLFEMEPLEEHREVRLPNAFSFSNTASKDFFHAACKERGIVPHPARMPVGLASFFIEFLTDAGDLVLDPFGGSNTTGYAAALANRRWVAIDAQEDYVEQSKLRFLDPQLKKNLKP